MSRTDHEPQSPANEPRDGLRSTWARSNRPVPRRVLRPLQVFLHTEASSGILLLAAAVVALVWANSPWHASYEDLWQTNFTVRLGPWRLSEDLRHWVNEGLMTFFFFVVGLEIKRELTTGELRDRRAAALPAIAAAGGMLVPAALFLLLNAGHAGERGWAIPMATDIAFAVGVLTIAARSASPNLKLFLLTLAIVDDIGAIAVIAVFYTAGIDVVALTTGAFALLLIVGARTIHVRSVPVYAVLGIGLWIAVFESGVDAAIAGAVLGLITPALPFQRSSVVSGEARRIADATGDGEGDEESHEWLELARLSREAVSPLARVETILHPWSSWVIVPLFALANAGVRFTDGFDTGPDARAVLLGIVVGLVIGKTIGISLVSWIAVRLGFGRLPSGVGWRHLVGGAAVAGVGFTVSLFIAELAFEGQPLEEVAKVGILVASAVAGIVGFIVLRGTAPARPPDERVLD